MPKTFIKTLAGLAALMLSLVPAGLAQAADPWSITTLAGSGDPGFAGDGGLSGFAKLSTPTDVAVRPGYGILIADTANHRIRQINPDWTITTVAGTGQSGFSGDGGAATAAKLSEPTMAAPLADGSFLVADFGNSRIRRVTTDGKIATVAGNGQNADNSGGGDGGTAIKTALDHPRGVSALPGGGYLIGDTYNHIVWRVDSAGTIKRLAGTGSAGYTGDGNNARSAKLNEPTGVALRATGSVLIADLANQRVREVTPDGKIRTAAGTGEAGFSEGPAASEARLNRPHGVAATADGGFLVADAGNNRIRGVTAGGWMFTFAGMGDGGFAGDGGPSTAAQLKAPRRVALLGSGFMVADSGNNRVRYVNGPEAAPPTETGGAPIVASEPPPTFGRTFAAQPERGSVRVKLPGRRGFVGLSEVDSVPVGTTVDATRGAVTLTVARDKRGRLQHGTFSSGRFKLTQKGGKRPLTDLVLGGGSFKGCGTARTASVADAVSSARRKKKRVRRLWSRAKGRFRTRGRYGAATVRGTRWLTEDRCDGTLVAVRSGVVAVRDKRRGKTVLVRRGERYLASAKGSRGR